MHLCFYYLLLLDDIIVINNRSGSYIKAMFVLLFLHKCNDVQCDVFEMQQTERVGKIAPLLKSATTAT